MQCNLLITVGLMPAICPVAHLIIQENLRENKWNQNMPACRRKVSPLCGWGEKKNLSKERVTAVTWPDTLSLWGRWQNSPGDLHRTVFLFLRHVVRLSAPLSVIWVQVCSFLPPLRLLSSLLSLFLVPSHVPRSSSPTQGASTCLSSSQAGRCVSKSSRGADREDLFRHLAACFYTEVTVILSVINTPVMNPENMQISYLNVWSHAPVFSNGRWS